MTGSDSPRTPLDRLLAQPARRYGAERVLGGPPGATRRRGFTAQLEPGLAPIALATYAEYDPDGAGRLRPSVFATLDETRSRGDQLRDVMELARRLGVESGAADSGSLGRMLEHFPEYARIYHYGWMLGRGDGRERRVCLIGAASALHEGIEAKFGATWCSRGRVAVERLMGKDCWLNVHLTFGETRRFGVELAPHAGLSEDILESWRRLFERLVEAGLCTPANAHWASLQAVRRTPLNGPRQGAINHDLSHVKLAVRGFDVVGAKAYVTFTPVLPAA